MDLEEAWDRGSLGKVPDRGAHPALAALALDREERLAVLEHDEVDFPFVGVA